MLHKNYPPFFTFLAGAVFALTFSAFATTIGTNITTSGSLGVATSTPSFPFSVDGTAFFDSPEIRFASSSAPTLTLAYQTAATSTILPCQSKRMEHCHINQYRAGSYFFH